jgi:hypothetical protein
MFWVWMEAVFNRWPDVLMIVKPETVLAWQRKGFRLFWTWRVRAMTGRGGPACRKKFGTSFGFMSRNSPRSPSTW